MPPTMFYEGPLQDGIALAVREAKLVVCFVRNDSQESSEWENDYFADEEITQLLKDKSVTLRLTEGTEEAGFLSSFCPVSKFPTVVVVKNGMLNEYIVAGTSKDDFRNRLRAVLTGTPATAISAPASSVCDSGNHATEAAQAASAPSPPSTAASAPPHTQPAQAESKPDETEASHPDAPRKPGHRISKEQAERRAQRHKEERERASTAAQEPKVESKPEKKETEPRRVDAPKKPGHRISREQAESRAQRHREEREQGQQDQDDVERGEAQPNTSATTAVDEAAERPQPRAPTQYRLQVRLFDGSSVRSSFSPSNTISSHVRPWLDEKRSDGDRPYTLKHILTPLPNHTISVAEEEQTLQDLGLGPTANLVMVPVQSYTEAYASSAASFPIRGLYAGYNLVSSAVGAVTGTIGSLLGYGGNQAASTRASSPTSSQRANGAARPRHIPSSGINIRTLRDQREERGNNQFYNGNQLNFEPRDDDRR